MGENRFHNIVSTVSRVSDNGDGGVQTILGPDWNRRFNCADDANDTDANELNPSGLWIRSRNDWTR
jgi:hypothetical protein